MVWKDQLRGCSETRLREFGEFCLSALQSPSEEMTRLLRAGDVATLASEVLDRVYELRFFGDKSVPSRPELENRYVAWLSSEGHPELFKGEYVLLVDNAPHMTDTLKEVMGYYYHLTGRHKFLPIDVPVDDSRLQVVKDGRIIVLGNLYEDPTPEEEAVIIQVCTDVNSKFKQ